ncbi:MAG TPA: sigma-70 family RNA polymerase sigma factor [Verrucomicrobiae bacterium]|jgi:RNA polymerase sigma-70 factor (ECF subfamily)
MTSTAPSTSANGSFPNTRWSVVVAARSQDEPHSAAALESLCRAYWYPLYAHSRRSGKSPHDAQDITQEFIYRLLEKRWLDSADPGKGKLRTFLIVALKNFMNNEWRRASAQRRGGGIAPIPIDTQFAETQFASTPAGSLDPDEAFDKEWALNLLQVTMNRLAAEFTGKKPGHFDALKTCLMGASGPIDYAALASRLDMNEGAARVAVHRLRKRFREIYREELSQTLANGEDLDSELRHLAAVLAT